MGSFRFIFVTALFSLTWRTVVASTNDEAKRDGNESKTASSFVSSNKQMGIMLANLFGNRKLRGPFSRIFRLDLIMCDCDTELPTTAPSAMNSTAPSTVETPAPSTSHAPSPKASSKPSLTPSQKPTSLPSLKPSLNPSLKPSGKPSLPPSLKPSSKPSVAPSGKPSLNPSLKPSGKPSLPPSLKPSLKPSLAPSGKPSLNPSLKPSGKPSLPPSLKPSSKPSLQPSSKPSKGPLTSFSVKRLTSHYMGNCLCVRWTDDDKVKWEDCGAPPAEAAKMLWTFDGTYVKPADSAKETMCLDSDPGSTEAILSDCGPDPKVTFEAAGVYYNLKKESLFYFNYDIVADKWFFDSLSAGVQTVDLEVGCTCSSCP